MTTVAALCCLTVLVFEFSELTHFMDGSSSLDPEIKKRRLDGRVAQSPCHYIPLVITGRLCVLREPFVISASYERILDTWCRDQHWNSMATLICYRCNISLVYVGDY